MEIEIPNDTEVDFNLALAEHFISGCKDFKWLETIKNVEAAIEEGEVIPIFNPSFKVNP